MEIRPILSSLLRSKTGAILIAAQIALTLAIVSNALFVVNQRLATATRPAGVAEAHLFQIALPPVGEVEDIAAMQRADVAALRAIPGVVSAAWSNQVPMGQSGWGFGMTLDPDDTATAFGAAVYFSGDSLVETLGLQVVEGRDFLPGEYRDVDPRTDAIQAESVVITRRTAERLHPDGRSALGTTVYVFGQGGPHPATVVGVIDGLMTPFAQDNENAHSSFLMPVRFLGTFSNYVIRVDDPRSMPAIQRQAEQALLELRNDRVLAFNRSLGEVRQIRYRAARALATILIAVTAGLLLVTGSGIVGMASLWVMQRRKQIGTRRALGARRIDILRYFLTENFLIGTAGVVIGLALAVALNDLLVRELSMPRLPVAYLLGGAIGLWLLGLAAVFGPAWRAASVPPAVATRSV